MATDDTTLTATLMFPSRAEYLLLARLLLAGVGRVRSIDDERLSDLKLAVTEACGNVVRHAYPDGVGPVRVAIQVTGDLLEVAVSDDGVGIASVAVEPTQHPDDGPADTGMGLAIIRAVADDLSVDATPDDSGTTVRFSVRLSRLVTATDG